MKYNKGNLQFSYSSLVVEIDVSEVRQGEDIIQNRTEVFVSLLLVVLINVKWLLHI